VNKFDEIIKLTESKGYNPIVGNIRIKQQQWLNWFRGDVNGFHTFNMKINGIETEFHRLTMNMPKKICEDYHSLIWNDKCQIKIDNVETKKMVDDVLEDNSFEVEFGSMMELAFGVGMGYMIEYLEDSVTKIDFINFENAIPLRFDNTKVTALLTMNYYKMEKQHITHLVYQYMEDDAYCVEHEVYVSNKEDKLGRKDNSKLMLITGKKVNKEKFIFKVSKPFFQVIRPNIKNHFDINSPYSVSIYATMLDYFVACDTLLDALDGDTETNKTRIIVDGALLKTKVITNDATGELQYINYFDKNDKTMLALPFKDSETDQKAIEFFSGVYQHDKIEIGLNAILRYIGFRAGLGKNYYSFQDGNVYQNETNVISTNADTYKSKKKHEQVIKQVIKDLVISILELEKIAGRYSGDASTENIEIIFDDSIVIDDEAIDTKYKELNASGMLASWRVVSRILKISETEAKEIVAEAEEASVAKQAAFVKAYDNDDDE